MVHLVSEKEKIHLSYVSDDGQDQFNYPKGLPFEIYVSKKGAEGKMDFDGRYDFSLSKLISCNQFQVSTAAKNDG